MEEPVVKPINILATVGGTLLVITFLFGIIYLVVTKANGITNNITESVDNVEESKYTIYDGEEVTGSSVVNMIKTTSSSSDDIYVLVKTKANTSGVYYVCDANNTRLSADAQRTLMKNARTKTNNNYITPTAKFYGEVIRNQNEAIVGIVFTQQ